MDEYDAYPLDPRLRNFTVRQMPLKRRQQLGAALNVEQVLESESGLARDFRGIAQQLELSHSEISRLERMIDPFGALLNYACASRLEVFELLRMIERIGRFDVLDDTVPGLVADIDANRINNERRDELVSYGSRDGEAIDWYDAYVCYADSDLEFVRSLVERLESAGLRLFVRERDQLAGQWEYETFARLVESQCRRVLIVLSPDFLLCPDCAFQSQFAASLGIEKRARVLIPLIYRPLPSDALPAMIRLLSKIDLASSPTWAMNRLVRSLLADKGPLPSSTANRPLLNGPPQTAESDSAFEEGSLCNRIAELPDPGATSVSILSNASESVSADDDHQKLIPPNGRRNKTKFPSPKQSDPAGSRFLASLRRKMKGIL